MTLLLRFLLLLAACTLFARADVIISEFLANNNTGLADEDGDRPDWIELFNNGTTSENLAGWRLTDESGNPAKWVLPAVSLPPNGFLIVFASNKNRTTVGQNLHTNFKLSAGGGYLGLYRPNGTPSSVFNPYPAQYPDKPYGTTQTVTTTSFVGTSAPLRRLVPTSSTPTAATWTARTFNDASWTTGTNAAGFESTTPGWAFRTVFANVSIPNLTAAETVLVTPAQQTSSTTVNHPVVNFNNSFAQGNFTPENPPPALAGGDVDYYVVEATGILTVPTSGVWTFSVASDDGCSLQIRPIGGSYTTVLQFKGLRGMAATLGTYNFPTAGDYEVRAVIFENAGGSGGEVSARQGNFSTWNSNFRLIGDTASGGLAIRSTPAGGGAYTSLVGANLLAPMFNAVPRQSSAYLRYAFNVTNPASVTTLTMPIKYDDGFVAYLNGTEVARRNVPTGTLAFNATANSERNSSTVLLGETVDLTPFVNQLVTGTNVLAIHGVNFSANDGDFLMQPQLAQYAVTPGSLAYFNTPTPGSFNTATVYNRVAPVIASVGRGFYTTAQNVQLTCSTAGATIYYTYDGSVPSTTNPAAASGTSPINLTINSTRTLRAVGVKAGSDNSDITTHTYLFTADIINQSATPVITNPVGATQTTTAFPTGTFSNGYNRINGQIMDYGMDPNIVTNPTYAPTIQDDLKAIPTISLVTDMNNLFHPSYGIHVNPGQDGDSPDPNFPNPINPPQPWERPASIELINPNGTPGFQANCGIRTRGGFSRSTDNPKHAFRVFFRDAYGTGKLKYDLFKNSPYGASGAKEFDKFDLRTMQNYSWSFGGDSNGIFVRDVVARDMQLAMGQPGSRGSFYHLYINGHYWGLFNIDERPEASYGATYFGGDSSEYDTIKTDPDIGYNIEATDGNLTAWQAFWTLADQTLPNAGSDTAKNAVYQQMKGNNPDGTRNLAYPVYLDDINLIDQMLIVYWGGNLDAPISNFLGNNSPNNFFVVRSRLGTSGGFKGILHDSEHTILPWYLNNTGSEGDRTGPWPAGSSTAAGGGGFSKSNPQYIFQQLVQHSTDFRQLFTDRVYKHMANGGVLTPTGASAIFEARIAEIDRAVVGESARWGNSKVNPAHTRQTWLSAVANARSFVSARTSVVIGQYRNKGWYPNFDPPVWSLRGGTVAPASTVTLTLPTNAPGGSSIYYTIDGSDPRQPGGAVAPTAILYSAPISISTSRLIRTRVWTGTSWSALDEAAFYVTQDFSGLAITEIHYNPLPTLAGGTDGENYEFLEFKNTGTSTLDLGGITFTSGLTYTFPAGTTLAPGAFYVLVKNATTFAARYPGVTIRGTFTAGNLSNGGEGLTLTAPSGGVILDLTYNDTNPWPAAADGNGFSIVPRGTVFNSSSGYDWRASASIHGSPGADDPAVSFPGIVVNEVLSNSSGALIDMVELHNPTAAPVVITDWWLTDDPNTPKKYRIPTTTIPAGGYATFTETQFNPTPGIGTSFAFSSAGDDVYLFSGDAAGNLTGYSHGFDFAGAEQNVSFGRYVNSVGEEQFPRQISRTFGSANSGPLVGSLVINEIMYNPFPGYDEYVEIRNISGSTTLLYDAANPANTWRIGGIAYTFPTGQSIPAGGYALIVNIDPATFRTKYSVPISVQIFGPYTGALQNGGERLSLEMPDTPVLNNQGATIVPYDVIDTVRYDDKAPWPNAADGAGPSLQRLTASAYADDPVNWFANGATPGLANANNSPPTVNITAPANNSNFTVGQIVNFAATASDGDGTIAKVEFYAGAIKLGEDTTAPYTFSWTATGGIQTITAKAIDNSLGITTSSPITLYVTQPVSQGLKGQYILGPENYTGTPVGTRIDANVTFSRNNNWPASFGFPGLGLDNYTVRWSGQYRATSTGTHTFRTDSDDGVRLTVNGNVLISNLTYHGTTTDRGTISLVAGQLYPITLEFFQGGGGAEIHLYHATPSNPTEVIIPQGVLYPDSAPIIITQPVALTREVGTSATFTVLASGIGNTYQWQRNNVNIPGATSDSLTLPHCLQADAGNYRVLVSNTNGFTISNSVALTVTLTDTDGDGMQNAWEIANGLNPNNAADATLDPDGDGMTNRQEYIAGTNPNSASSRLFATVAKNPGGPGHQITFTAQPYKTYTVQYRDSMTTGSWLTLQTYPVSATQQTIIANDTAGASARFYRVQTP